jgi:RHS repeat-associated protein
VKYRYGFNGKELDKESNLQDYGMRIYNPELCKFLSVDPISDEYPWLTPYQFSSNRPIECVDIDGLEGGNSTRGYINNGNQTYYSYRQSQTTRLRRETAQRIEEENVRNNARSARRAKPIAQPKVQTQNKSDGTMSNTIEVLIEWADFKMTIRAEMTDFELEEGYDMTRSNNGTSTKTPYSKIMFKDPMNLANQALNEAQSAWENGLNQELAKIEKPQYPTKEEQAKNMNAINNYNFQNSAYKLQVEIVTGDYLKTHGKSPVTLFKEKAREWFIKNPSKVETTDDRETAPSIQQDNDG